MNDDMVKLMPHIFYFFGNLFFVFEEFFGNLLKCR